MSSTDTRTVDPAQPHPSENGGHEMSDFSWTTVMWLIPLASIILFVFVFVSVFWFKAAKDRELDEKQAALVTTELNILRAKDNEILTQYKWLDKEKGRVRIPVARAMELLAKEHQDIPGREWTPVTDTYLIDAPFKAESAQKAGDEPSTGISIESVSPPGTSGAAAPMRHPTSVGTALKDPTKSAPRELGAEKGQ